MDAFISSIFTFMVPILVTFIQIIFPYAFEIHHNKFILAMVSLLGYCFFAIAQHYFPTYAPKLSMAIQNYFPTYAPKLRMAIEMAIEFSPSFSASLSVASLVSILLPKPWDNVPYMIYGVYIIGHCLGFVRTLRASERTLPCLLPMTVSELNPTNREQWIPFR